MHESKVVDDGSSSKSARLWGLNKVNIAALESDGNVASGDPDSDERLLENFEDSGLILHLHRYPYTLHNNNQAVYHFPSHLRLIARDPLHANDTAPHAGRRRLLVSRLSHPQPPSFPEWLHPVARSSTRFYLESKKRNMAIDAVV